MVKSETKENLRKISKTIFLSFLILIIYDYTLEQSGVFWAYVVFIFSLAYFLLEMERELKW